VWKPNWDNENAGTKKNPPVVGPAGLAIMDRLDIESLPTQQAAGPLEVFRFTFERFKGSQLHRTQSQNIATIRLLGGCKIADCGKTVAHGDKSLGTCLDSIKQHPHLL